MKLWFGIEDLQHYATWSLSLFFLWYVLYRFGGRWRLWINFYSFNQLQFFCVYFFHMMS